MPASTGRPLRSTLAGDELVAIFDRLPTGVLVLDSEHTVRYVNLAAQRLLHSAGARLRPGASLPELGAPIAIPDLVRQAFRRGFLSETQVALADNRILTISVTILAKLGVGVVQLEDVTERLRRSQAEEDFVVNAAHEILAPLASISSAVQVLEDGAKEVPEERDRFIGHIEGAVDRLISISQALLALARAEAGIEPLRWERVPLGSLLRGVLEDAGVDATGAVLSAGQSAAFADRDLLSLLLSTIVPNARRHAPDGLVEAFVDDSGSGIVTIDIVDHGRGIPEERVERITSRFVSGEGRDSNGYGVGLSIAARAARLLGGELSIESGSDGTRVRVTVPSSTES